MEPGLRDRENPKAPETEPPKAPAAMEPGLRDRENVRCEKRPEQVRCEAAMEPGLRDRENQPIASSPAASMSGRNGARPERPGKQLGQSGQSGTCPGRNGARPERPGKPPNSAKFLRAQPSPQWSPA